MKKLLLLSLIGSALTAAAVEQPMIIPDYLVSGISANGQWIGMGYSGSVVLLNTKTFDVVGLVAVDGESYYTEGQGNYVSNDGVMLLSINDDVTASYLKDGKIYSLDVPDEHYMNLANGITADGSRICGSVGTAAWSLESKTMLTPAVWDRQPDGTYGKYTLLPRPDTDYMGSAPMYVTANFISDDGRTVLGQVLDNMGLLAIPIVYRQDDAGAWSYELPGYETVITDPTVEVPSFPADVEAEYPDYEQYMTPDEFRAFTAAEEAFWAGQTTEYPDLKDYMTAEEYAAFSAAMDAYNAENERFDREYDAWLTAMRAATAGGAMFAFNNLWLSANGRYAVTTNFYTSMDLRGNMVTVSEPYVFDLQEGTHRVIRNKTLLPYATQVTSDGTVLATGPLTNDEIRFAYVVTPDGKLIDFQDYVKSVNEVTYDWMEENMRHDYTSFEGDVPVPVKDGWLTGSPIANDDLTVLACWVFNAWANPGDTDEAFYYSYLMPGRDASGVHPVMIGGDVSVRACRGGSLTLSGDVASVEVFDLRSRMVFRADNPAYRVETGLGRGIYAVRLTDRAGNATTQKVAF